MTAPTSWQPLVTGELARALRTSLDEILGALMAERFAAEDPFIALLYAYADRAARSDEHGDRVRRRLEGATAALAEGVPSPALYDGFTGVAWLAAHIAKGEAGDEDPNTEIDSVLHALLARVPWSRDYDLISGIVGIGVYFLERLKVPSAADHAAACLELVVKRLAELAQYSPLGATWLTLPQHLPNWQRELAPNGHYNFGVAHGIPGALALLGQVCEARIGGPRVYELLGQGVNWLLAQPPTQGPSRFPSWRRVEVDACTAAAGSRVA